MKEGINKEGALLELLSMQRSTHVFVVGRPSFPMKSTVVLSPLMSPSVAYESHPGRADSRTLERCCCCCRRRVHCLPPAPCTYNALPSVEFEASAGSCYQGAPLGTVQCSGFELTRWYAKLFEAVFDRVLEPLLGATQWTRALDELSIQ